MGGGNRQVNYNVHSCPKVCFNLKAEEQGFLPHAWHCWTQSLCNISISITGLCRRWSHRETETAREKGQSDFPSQGVRGTLHRVPHLHSHPKTQSHTGSRDLLFSIPGEGHGFSDHLKVSLPWPLIISSPAVFSLSCFAHYSFRPEVTT